MIVTQVAKWGNSSGVRLPKAILEKAHINIDDEVTIYCKNNTIIIEKVQERNWYERLKDAIVKETNHDSSYYHGQINLAYAAELITKEQKDELCNSLPDY